MLQNTRLQLGNETKFVNLKIPVMFIIGDNQGGDAICGRHIHYGKTARRISQTCDAGPSHLSNPVARSCSRLLMKDVINLVQEEDGNRLYDLYQAQHWIAWFDLDYGGNPEGIFTAACPPEALHALENGIFLHVLKELFENILNPRTCGHLDAHVYSWNNYPGQHFLRGNHIDGFPRLLFTNGISSLTELKADDKVGIIFCVIIAALQAEGKEILVKYASLENVTYRNIIYVFELMLCYRAWLKKDTYWYIEDNEALLRAQDAIETLLKEITTLIPRKTGNNWDIVKIHEQLHVAENIVFFGAHRNVHTGPQEHNHIQNTKKPSKQVQRNKCTFDWQLGNRLADKYIIDSAHQEFVSCNQGNNALLNKNADKAYGLSPCSSKFTFCLKAGENVTKNVNVSYKWITLSCNVNPLSKPLLVALIDHFGDNIYDQPMIGFSELKLNNILYWASIKYRKQGCWYDNALIRWEAKPDNITEKEEDAYMLVPSELRQFFKFENSSTLYCIVHSCEYEFKQHSVLSVLWKKEYIENRNATTKEPLYCVIKCNSIDSHCLMLPYQQGSEYVLQVMHPTKWANEFLSE